MGEGREGRHLCSRDCEMCIAMTPQTVDARTRAHTQMPHCSSLSPTCSASAAVGDERAEGRAPASASAKGANGRASARTSAEDICPHQCIRSRSKECARGGTLASTSAEGADARSAARRRMSRCRPGSPCAQRRSEPRGRWAYRPSVTS